MIALRFILSRTQKLQKPVIHVCTCLAVLFAPSYAQQASFISFIHDTHLSSAFVGSPDGKNVYAGGLYTIAVFARRPDGALETVQVLNNNHAGIRNLFHVIDLAVSPDGRYLYAANVNDSSLLLFARDGSSGEIRLLERMQDEVFKNQGIFPGTPESFKLLFSSDGKNLYWLYNLGGVLTVFARDAPTGGLTKVQVLRKGAHELGQFNLPWRMAISSDGKHIYAGGGNEGKLLILSRNAQDGQISYVNYYDMGRSRNGNWQKGSIAISPEDSTVFVTDTFDDNVVVLKRNPENGKLEKSQSLTPNAPKKVLLSPDGKQAYLFYYDAGSYFALYERDRATGQIRLIDPHAVKVDAYSAAYFSHSFITPFGDAIYVSSVEGRVAIQRDTYTGTLNLVQHFKDNVGGVDRLYVGSKVVVSTDNKYLYSASRFTDAGINTFKRDEQNGELSYVGFDSLPGFNDLAVSPNGRHLYASDLKLKQTAIHTFSLDENSGEVRLIQTRNDSLDALVNPEWAGSMCISPEGNSLYLNNKSEIVRYARDPISGLLTLQERIRMFDYGLWEIYASTVSPDGKHFYAQGERYDNDGYALSIFARDLRTGQLTFESAFIEQQPPYVTIADAAMAFAPDGRHLYAASRDNGEEDATLRIFSRNVETGEVTQVDRLVFPQLLETWDIEVTSSGDEVHALFTSYGSNGEIAVFNRDLATGKLTCKQSFASGREGVYGIDQPRDLAFSPDEKFFYVADVNGIATFATGRGTTAVEQQRWLNHIPRALTLEQNYPNPFSSSTTHTSQRTTIIHYEIAPLLRGNAQPVELAIYNTQGQLVNMLVNEAQASGKHAATWNGMNAQGQLVPSGVYFYRLKMGEHVVTKKLLLVR